MKGEVRRLRKQKKRIRNELSAALKDRDNPNRTKTIHILVTRIRAVDQQISEMLHIKGNQQRREKWQEEDALVELNEKFARGIVKPLKCPKCGEPDRGNVVNGEPYCIKCMVPLESESSNTKKPKKPRYKPPEDWRKTATFKKVEGIAE